MLLVIVLQILYGASIPLNKFLLTLCPPIYFSGLRKVLAGSLLLGGAFFFYRRKWVFRNDHIKLYLQAAFFGVYLKYIFRNWSLSLLPAVKMGFLLSASPFISALFSYYFFKEIHSKKQWIGLTIGLAGLIPVLLLKAPSEQLTAQFFALSLPELVTFAAILCHIYGMVVTRKLAKKEISSVMINGFQMFVGGCGALLTGIYFEGWFPITQPLVFGKWLVALIFLSNVVCHTLYVKLLKKYTVTFVSFTDFLDPIMIAFYSRIFLKEQISWHYGASAIIVFVGLYLFYQDELQVDLAPSHAVSNLSN